MKHIRALSWCGHGSVAVAAAIALSWSIAFAQTPGEVPQIAWCGGANACLQWGPVASASRYQIVRGAPSAFPALLNSGFDSCQRLVVQPTGTLGLSETPPAGGMFWYLVDAVNVCGQGAWGNATAGSRIVNPGYNCEPMCADTAVDGVETDVDCGGGTCAPCADAHNCIVASDCASNVCFGGVCQSPSCSDAVQNGGETAVDCGGASCAPCANGQPCCVASDCQSATCSAGVCTLSACMNGVIDGFETDVDCGGGVCPRCGDSKHCALNSDCTSNICTLGLCRPASCSDGVKNGNETDIDCGGLCVPCGQGKHCNVGADCGTAKCVDGVCCNTSCNGLCQACTTAKKGSGADGTCGNIQAGSDPDNECAGSSTCNGVGGCGP